MKNKASLSPRGLAPLLGLGYLNESPYCEEMPGPQPLRQAQDISKWGSQKATTTANGSAAACQKSPVK